MEVKVSSLKLDLSPSEATDPDENEISEGEDEDDDRNHKHRKRETLSQSLDGNSHDHSFTGPYRKRNKPHQNGYSSREGDPQPSDTWRNNHSRFEKRRFNQYPVSRAPSDLNHQIRENRLFPSEADPIWGRGREPAPWGPLDSRLGMADRSSPFPSGPFSGRGMSNVSNMHSTPWNGYGLVPGVPNLGLDALHPLGLQGVIGPVIAPPMNIGIPLQRCRDFDERGFCLRGDMCPMEHGLNRIVVEDVQSLSQFNLPGSQLLGTSSRQVPIPAQSSSSGALVNSKSLHSKFSKPGATDDVGSDVYDPDQPLWGNDNPETSGSLQALNQSNIDETGSLLDAELSDQQNMESYERFRDEPPLRTADNTESVWGRIGGSKPKLVPKGKTSSVRLSLERDIKTDEALHSGSGFSRQDKWKKVDKGLPLKPNSDSVRNIDNLSNQTIRTLFLNGIPLKDNRRESLLSHFQKFGNVIDIRIPMRSDRAFVQFSNREEAEAAMRAPDAVLGNRFIRLQWARRDNIPESEISGTNSMPVNPIGKIPHAALTHPSLPDKEVNMLHVEGGKNGHAHDSVTDKPEAANIPKDPSVQKPKLESLELMREEIRKKQELLDLRRSEFKRRLDKLQKQSSGAKEVIVLDQTSKRLKVETPLNETKADPSISSPIAGPINNTTRSSEHEPSTPSARPLTAPGPPLPANRFKLDNRPTAFRILSPLPAGLTNVTTLEEHFSTFGDLSSVELEESELQDVSACVSFATRRFAEKAFLHGKVWKGQNLQFTWLKATLTSAKGSTGSGNLQTSSNIQSESKESMMESIHSPKFESSKSDEVENLNVERETAVVETGKDSSS